MIGKMIFFPIFVKSMAYNSPIKVKRMRFFVFSKTWSDADVCAE